MAPKRNDPCHCGSGKKYKHCHLKDDREREKVRKQSNAIPTIDSPIDTQSFLDEEAWNSPELDEEDVEEEIDPEDERLEQLYETFNAAKYEDQVTILRSAIENQLLDGELAFEIFHEFYPDMIERGDREEFADLVSLLRSKQPEIYEEENAWFWSWEVTNALALNDDNALQSATDQLIENGGRDLDQFYPVFACLLYHGRRTTLMRALKKHVPRLVPGKYFEFAESELHRRLSNLIVVDYIESHDQDKLLEERHFEELCSQLDPFVEALVPDGLKDFISRAAGLTRTQWTMDDFQLQAKRQRREDDFWSTDDEEDETDPAVLNLCRMADEFLYFARSVESIPLTKAEMAREHIVDYVFERYQGELTDSDDFRAPRSESHSRKKKKKHRNQPVTHLLLPDHRTLDRFLMRFFGFMANRTYEGAAFFELIPAWTRFLQAKGLVTNEESQQSLNSLQALSQSMVAILERNRDDPVLAANMRNWQSDAANLSATEPN